jgi:integrase
MLLRRRLKVTKKMEPWVAPEQLMALLDAANPVYRPMFATLAGTGLRPNEACALDWRDVNLETGTLRVRKSKTDAGVRYVDLPRGVMEELRAHRSSLPRGFDSEPVFRGEARDGERNRMKRDSVGRRLKTAIRRANRILQEAGIEPIDTDVSPKALRRTYASLRIGLGDDPAYVARQIGHKTANFTMEVYAEAIGRREKMSGAYLRAFDRALEWGQMGSGASIAQEIQSEGIEPETANLAS